MKKSHKIRETAQHVSAAVTHLKASAHALHLVPPHMHMRPPARLQVSRRSLLGLYVANFLLAELVGVLIPLLNDYLFAHSWSYEAIGGATAMAGLGLLVAQLPAGILLDRMREHRYTLMGASVLVGSCFGLLPLAVDHPWSLDTLLFISGVGQAFIMPLLGTLALLLAGHAGVNKLLGSSQSYNHAGNIAASCLVMTLVVSFGMEAPFYAIAAISVAAALSCLLIRKDELQEESIHRRGVDWREIALDRRTQRLFLCSLLYHLANAAVTPIVAMYSRTIGAADGFVTFLVFVAQAAMVLAAMLAGRFGDQLGRRPVMGLAFLILPVRIVLYALLDDPNMFLAVAVLDGLGVGIYQVIVASMCADIDADRGRFNLLISLMFSALALGGVISPLVGGLVVQHFGFRAAFYLFAGIAALAAGLFFVAMPETQEPESA